MKQLFAAVAFVACLAGPATAAPDAVQTAADFHAALAAGDAEAAAALLADDVTIYEEGWVERSKAEYVARHLPDDIAFSRQVTMTTASSQTFTRGDTAWVISEGTSKGTFQGKPVDRVNAETMVLRLDQGGWRIVHMHWSSHKAPSTTP